MSEVISFRLNKDNPREAQARAVIKAWGDKEYSARHVLTEALLAHQGSQRELEIRSLSTKLDEISRMLQQNKSPLSCQKNEVSYLIDFWLLSGRQLNQVLVLVNKSRVITL